MPKIVGGAIMGKRVKCYTQQGTDAGVSESDCRAWLANPPFDPYRVAEPDQAKKAESEKPSTQGQNEPSTVLIGDGTARPPATAGKRS